MKKLTILTLCVSFLIFGCASSDRPVTSEESGANYIYWINSLKRKCVGVAPMQCLQVQKGNELTDDGWLLFYDTIKGFKYKQGYLYKIVVKEEDIPPEQVPADTSSNKYTLVKVLEKKVDSKLRLYDLWALESIKGKQIHPEKGQERPRLEINLKKMAIVGNDGCNDFMGRIVIAGSEKLAFGRIAVTMKDCIDMDIPDRFHKHINTTRTYAIKGLRLYLFDSRGNELFAFRKID